jgi:hypothetical protein
MDVIEPINISLGFDLTLNHDRTLEEAFMIAYTT